MDGFIWTDPVWKAARTYNLNTRIKYEDTDIRGLLITAVNQCVDDRFS